LYFILELIYFEYSNVVYGSENKKQTVSFMGIIDLFQKLPFEITNSDTLISNQFTRIDGFIEYSIIFKLILLFKPYQFNMYFFRISIIFGVAGSN